MIHFLVGAKEIKDAEERLLADIVDQLPGSEAITERKPDGVGEMLNKMPLSFRVALAETDEVLTVKGRFAQE
jgi:hypothetical protein